MGHPTPTEEELDDIMKKHDKQGRGYLILEEFKEVFFATVHDEGHGDDVNG